ncbi:MAG: nucleotidyl transferase AbiEii/AbiGii toxin family protein [Alphaproteobacteria bacterium]
MNAKKDIAASVRQRLLNQSREAGDGSGFNRLLVRYAIERLLYRISISRARETLVLKGAMLFVLWSPSPMRATGDLDLLGSGANDPDSIAGLFADLCRSEGADDGLVFDAASITIEPMREEEQYPGVRIRLVAMLGTARIPFQVDIGFGDVVHPEAQDIEYPRLLNDFPAARLRAYPPETVIAEKFEAMVRFDELTTRLKDHYDLWALSRTFEFDMPTLAEAIRKTFERRKTELPDTVPAPLTAEFAAIPGKQQQWQAFLRLTAPTLEPPTFGEVISDLSAFLAPVLKAVGDGTGAGRWTPERGWH